MRTNRNRPVAVCLAGLLSLAATCIAGAAHAQMLKTVTERGALNCGVSEGLYGFSARDAKGNWSGFDVDLCRAIAAAIFNDAGKVNYTPLAASRRFRGASIRRHRRPLAQYHVDDVARDRAWTELCSDGVLIILLGGVAAYSLWPRGGLGPRASNKTFEQPVANAPYVYLRQPVYYRTTYPVGTIIVDKAQNFLYVVRPSMSALRYGIGVGSECVPLAGLFKVARKEEWPGWKQPPQQSAGAGDDRLKNPLGARALYLNTDNRIHGTNAPVMIGRRAPDGCIRLVNDDVIYLYDRTPLESRVVVLN